MLKSSDYEKRFYILKGLPTKVCLYLHGISDCIGVMEMREL
jgi:hypothetical protein